MCGIELLLFSPFILSLSFSSFNKRHRNLGIHLDDLFSVRFNFQNLCRAHTLFSDTNITQGTLPGLEDSVSVLSRSAMPESLLFSLF